MNKSTALASFALCAASALGVGALSGLTNMLGSDTLFQVTTAAITGSGANLVYDGTGSGNGEGAMVKGTQTIAPMSRFTQGSANGTPTVCPVAADAGNNAEGLVIALDGITIVGAQTTSATSACNGPNNTASDAGCPAPLANVGPAYDGTTPLTLPISGTTYTFANWKDVLAVMFGGKDHTGAINCNSELRNYIANNYTKFFENQSGCTSTKCTTIEHLFRRDDGSGTSDAFAALTGLASVSEFVNAAGVETGVGVGKDPFCNTAQTLPAALASDPQTGTPRGMLEPGTYQDNDPVRRKCANTTGNLASSHGVATEEVCGPDGTLGLVLPVVPTDFLQTARGETIADQYPVQLCNSTDIVSIVPQTLKTSHGVVIYGNGQCPNGDDPKGGTFCDIPVYDPSKASPPGSGPVTAECLAQGTNKSPLITSSTPIVPTYVTAATAPAAMGSCTTNSQCSSNLCVIPGTAFGSAGTTGFCGCATNADCGGTSSTVCTQQTITVGSTSETYGTCNAAWNPNQNASIYLASQADGRAYNEVLWNALTGVQTDTFNRNIVGAYYRIHSTLTMNTPNTTGTCQQEDATLQIGCLVQASPCSLGYAGRTALTWDVPSGSAPGTLSATTGGLKINEIAPADACITGADRGSGEGHGFVYPFSRKLYLDTLIGFANVTGDEQTLYSYEANAANIDPIVAKFGFLALPSDSVTNNGQPYYEDFNEQALCGASSNNVAPAPAGNLETVCGNGKIEAYEDCDNGAANVNGGATGTCSLTCRTN